MSAQDDLIDLVELRTDRFAPFLPDDSQVNPGVYGAELAYWLTRKLASCGVTTSYPEREDWAGLLITPPLTAPSLQFIAITSTVSRMCG